MRLTRRDLHRLGAGLPLALALAPGRAAGAEKLTFAVAGALSPIAAPFVVPRGLGYYAQEGLDVDVVALGTSAATAAAAHQGRIDAYVGVPSFQLPVIAHGAPKDVTFFFEYTYPFKWGVAVRPGAAFKQIEDFRGHKIGVHDYGTAEYPIAKSLVAAVGLDPDKDVSIIAVGEGASGGYALQKGDIDGLVDNDVDFGAIEAAGVKMDYLPLPARIPHVGGLYIATLTATLAAKTQQMIGLARAVAKANVFTAANPEAAAYLYLQAFPESAPLGKSLAEQVAAVAVPLRKRAKILFNYNTTQPDIGFMNPQEMTDEIAFNGLAAKLKPADIAGLTTNQYIKQINAFDRPAIAAAARAYKIPGL